MKRMLILTTALALLTAGAAQAAPAKIYFTKGEQLATAPRPAATLTAALRALVAGPTAAERRRGYRSNIPAGTRLLGVSVRDGIARVNLSRRFESGGGSFSIRGRLAQLVWTATQFRGVKAVRLALEGRLVESIGGEGVMVDKPLTRTQFLRL